MNTTDDITALAKLRLEDLLTFFGVNTSVKVVQDGERIELNVDADTSGRLIGHRGETLLALQHLVNRMVKNHTDEKVFVVIDIAGYRKARADELATKAKHWADKVTTSGEPETLRPMNAAERRIVHMTLSTIAEVETESVGEDPKRRIVIKPRQS